MSVKGRTAAVTVKVDTALKKLWTEASRRLAQANTEGASSWDARYEAVADIVEHQPPLYLAGGFSTEAAFFEAVVKEARSAVYRNVRVAKYATAKEVETYGASRLDLAITFVELRNGGPLRGRTPIDFRSLRFPVEGGTKRLADLTVQQLRSAIATLKGRNKSSTKASPQAKAIAALLSMTKVSGLSLDVRRDVLVLRVPLDSIAVVGRALAQYEDPT